ncbi:phosphotransferase KptA/Tpt1 [Wallemia mellicola]|uniref:2'-phosphotransferase n=1 Tax=Wallemia mellicola TaxID=1708541 RepID=A0A4T0MA06_9BASI|nr:phosphotransferase KptA/Tpt1 [Wallemia mellicola]TIB79809.1 phosphotransferase KptA/Tpt1 [Wallemia mellicola]TIB83753.1 phosphotransferase KptA/Tpt1 [Wallemia mellicola]TIB86067.1 phosphotransferase KptA/Tpt1 [Wallemia mellicola]TIB94909.1 phosphotransferase KptA/Tpt1 [Wallemia mellicola]
MNKEIIPPKSAKGRVTDSPDVRYSKTLSYILRHGALKEGLFIRKDGFIKVDDLLQRPKLKGLDYELLQHLVRTNDKKRYQLLDEDGVKLIRAVQGHTLDTSDLELTQILKPSDASIAVHGTNPDAWNKISLKTMGRQYIHLATGLPGDSENNHWKSLNGVILTNGLDGTLPTKYFAKVQNKDGLDI